ncbi:hypothetical protein A2U01_0109005, partial [Trifolium medium]|nr:hypothetical protein [Trifolium medium]
VTSSSLPSADSSYHGPLCSRDSSSTLSFVHSEFRFAFSRSLSRTSTLQQSPVDFP